MSSDSFITVVHRGQDDAQDHSWQVKSSDLFRASPVFAAFFANPRSLEKASLELVIAESSKEAIQHFLELIEYPKFGGLKFAELANILNVGLIAALIDKYETEKLLFLAKDLYVV